MRFLVHKRRSKRLESLQEVAPQDGDHMLGSSPYWLCSWTENGSVMISSSRLGLSSQELESSAQAVLNRLSCWRLLLYLMPQTYLAPGRASTRQALHQAASFCKAFAFESHAKNPDSGEI